MSELRVEEEDFKEDKANFCTAKEEGGFFILENQFIIAKFGSDALLHSLVHKKTGRETIESPANLFVIFDDMCLFWGIY